MGPSDSDGNSRARASKGTHGASGPRRLIRLVPYAKARYKQEPMPILEDILGAVVLTMLVVYVVWGGISEYRRSRQRPDENRRVALSWCRVDDEDELTMADGSVYRLVTFGRERSWRSFPDATAVDKEMSRQLYEELERLKLAEKWRT